MPNQSLLYTGRVLACSQLPAMMHIARELCGGQICVTPDAATFADPETGAVDGEVLHDQRRVAVARTGASCWRSRATCSTPTTPGTG